MDIITESLYVATLTGHPRLLPKERMKAELQFCRTLERLLDGQAGVAATYGAWCAMADSDEADAPPEDRERAAAWTKAFDQAKQEGLRGLGYAEGASFEVRLG